MLLCSRLELLPNVLGKDIGCGGGGSGGENASGIQMKEDGVQPTLCLQSIRDIVLCEKKKKVYLKKNKYFRNAFPPPLGWL